MNLLNNAILKVPTPSNETIYSYAPGTPEKAKLKAAMDELLAKKIEIPLIIGGKEIRTGKIAQVVLPHDHQTWGIVCGIDGVETNINWLRNDDGSKAGFADLTAAHELRVGPGDVAVFMPDDIHSVRNDSDKTTLSLHIYGKSLSQIDRSEFDPDSKTVRPCPKREKKAAA